MNKTLAALLAAALASPLLPAPRAHAETAAVAGQAQVLESLHLAGVIEVDASGRVENVTLQPNSLLPTIEQNVLDAMRDWTFEPYLLEGIARRVRTSVFVRVDLEKGETGHQLMLGNAEFGQPLLKQTTAPRYPAQSLRKQIAAEVLLRLTLDDSGGVVQVEPVSARVLNQEVRNERRHRQLVEPFVRASVEAMQSWRFDFVEARADGAPHQVLVPVTYNISGRSAARRERVPQSAPVLFALSTTLGRPLEALAREAGDRPGGVSIHPVPSPLRLRANRETDANM